MPDLNPSYTSKSVRQNGSWGKGINALTLGKAPTAGGISYAAGYVGNSNEAAQGTALAACTATSGPFCNPGQFMIGDAPRSAAYGLRNPSSYNINMGLRRTFDITKESVKFVFAADCTNATNHNTFGGINIGVDNNTFGTVSTATGSSGSRDFQFSGRLNF
jgi:hypothetical protein